MAQQLGPRSIFLIAGGLLVVVTALGLWNSADASGSLRSRAADGGGAGALDAPTGPAQGEPATEWAGESASSRRRSRARHMPGIHGVVLDWFLQPLPGAVVQLAGGDGVPQAEAVADPDGLFSFVDLAADDYTVATVGRLYVDRRVRYVPGSSNEIELKLPGPAVLLTGRLRGDGAPVVDRGLLVLGDDALGHVEERLRTDADGVFRCLLRPGDYELCVERAATGPRLEQRLVADGEVRWVAAPPLYALRLPLDLGDPSPRRRVELELPAAALSVTVIDRATGRPVAGARVELAGCGAGLSDAQGRFRIDELPPARYEVAVSAPGWPRPAPQSVDFSVGQPPGELSFELQPGGAVAVALLGDDGRELPWLPEYRAVIRGADDPGPGDAGEPFASGARERRFVHAPAGACELVIADLFDGDTVRFGPLDPVRAPLQVPPGSTARASVPGIRPRAFGSFAIVDVVGQPISGAELQVWTTASPLRRVLPHESAMAPGRWEGWLAPGGYDVTAVIGGARLRERLHVDRDDVEFTFRPGR